MKILDQGLSKNWMILVSSLLTLSSCHEENHLEHMKSNEAEPSCVQMELNIEEDETWSRLK